MKDELPRVRLERQVGLPPEPPMGADQRAVLDQLERPGHVVVVGAPGTGKTSLVVAAATHCLQANRRCVALGASRQLASGLRRRITTAYGAALGEPAARTVSSLAFAILGARASALGEAAPRLISGPEQDAILRDLLAGQAAGDVAPIAWPAPIGPDTIRLRAFRAELRDLLMRAAEHGITPNMLAELGKQYKRPGWVASAEMYERYLDVLALRESVGQTGRLYDPAEVIQAAADAVEHWDTDTHGAASPHWDDVIVDDYQEATAATQRLLHVLAGQGSRLILIGCPDVTAQAYRGALPQLLAQAQKPLPDGFDAYAFTLSTMWHRSRAVGRAISSISDHIRTAELGTRARRHTDNPTQTPREGTVECAELTSDAQETAYIAYRLREAHVLHGLPWARMAVLTRSNAQVSMIAAALGESSVPVDVPGVEVAVRDQASVRPLLAALHHVCHPHELTADGAVDLLASPLGGLDAAGIRQLRRHLREYELACGGTRSSDDLLIDALTDPTPLAAENHAPEAKAAARCAAILQAGTQALAGPTPDAGTVLWAMWAASGLAKRWRETALGPGREAIHADKALDAVTALFAAAERYTDRVPGASAAMFEEYLRGQDLPGDMITHSAPVEQAVTVCTAASAAGREWDFVVVASVQEGVWPNVRLRDTLLGAGELVDVVEDRGLGTQYAEKRRAILDDELRSFNLALSRATTDVLITAISSGDERPSPFIDLVDPAMRAADPQNTAPMTRKRTAPLPLDIRGLVTAARRAVESDPLDEQAAHVLAALAANGVGVASPDMWHGLMAPSSDTPLFAPGDIVQLRPSAVETLRDCPLRWVLESAGGHQARGLSAQVGELIHTIAERFPTGSATDMMAELDSLWPSLGLDDSWSSRREHTIAARMVEQLAIFVQGKPSPMAVEQAFTITREGLTVNGRVDRIEAVADDDPAAGGYVIDFKTGSQAPSKNEAARHPQMGIYQLGVGAHGAALVYLKDAQVSGPRRVTQQPLESFEEPWVENLLVESRGKATSNSFVATANEHCPLCPTRFACPIRDEGKQVAS